MKKVSIIVVITLGILAIIVLEGRALHQLRTEPTGNTPEMLPFYLLSIGQEWVAPVKTQPCHHSEI
ncbi:hypothetical protein [Chitinophaga filiformis]|uniref:Uncharacterized protein n=1 Tax=Chitinophaga filiformis TaxID=104663 RepID=A0A1G7YED9_CHIFI|nr:hypothetical protein [Chitinophaga filiformis]SDG94922.1 hypothetical protein SAMN04488121_107320 [Chitinophaga filiformis]